MTEQTNTASKPVGKCKALHALWHEAGNGEPLPRAFAIELAIAQGANPSTARTQVQRWLASFQHEQAQPAAATTD